MSVETVRPAGAGHETLYVLLGSVLILALAATVVGLRQQSHEAQALDAHQVDARLDLNAAEQGIYADLQVAAEDIQLSAELAGNSTLAVYCAGHTREPDVQQGVPMLEKVPYVSKLFKGSPPPEPSELVILLTPRIIPPEATR